MAGFLGAKGLALLLELLIKSSLAFALAMGLFLLFRKRSAALKHFILSLFLMSSLLFPLLSYSPLGWETRLLPSQPLVDSPPPLENRPELRVRPRPAEAGRGITEDPLNSVSARGTGFRSAGGKAAGATSIPANWLTALWAAGTLLLLIRLGLGLLGAFRLSREGVRLDDPSWLRILSRFLSAVALRRKIRLKSHEKIAVPLTWGVFKPVILLPGDSQEWPEDRRSSVLFHELSHIKRVDFLIMMLIRLSLALYWFNPLSWIVLSLLKKEQEKACDELVLRAGVKPSIYAANLLAFQRASKWGRPLSPAILGLLGRSQLNDRLLAILKPKASFKEIKMKTKMMLVLSLASCVALLGLARPAESPAPAPPQPDVLSGASSPLGVQSVPPQEDAVAQEKAQSQEAENQAKREQEKQKKEEKQKKLERSQDQEKKTKVYIIKAGKGQITIDPQGAESKSLIIEQPVIVISGDSMKNIKVKAKTIALEKAGPYHFTIHLEASGLQGKDFIIKNFKLPKMGLIIREEILKKILADLQETSRQLSETLKAKADIQEKVLRQVEEKLEKIRREIEKTGAPLKDIKIRIEEHPLRLSVIKDKEGQVEKIKEVICIPMDLQDKAAFDQVIEKFKKELPPGASFESEFKEDSRTAVVTIKIPAGAEAEGADVALKKLIEALVRELKKETPDQN
jgi:beta-lactamase regulating signal transducer with metallopeptidase domain